LINQLHTFTRKITWFQQRKRIRTNKGMITKYSGNLHLGQEYEKIKHEYVFIDRSSFTPSCSSSIREFDE
jgi:hypothetical protein